MTMTGAPAQRIRVLVVDDSPTARDLICALIGEDPQLTVCGVAGDGREAVTRATALRPDLITMDLRMPVLDGLAAIVEIMDACATRILVVSDIADAANAMAAVARGALDATYKPGVDDGPAFTRRIRLLAGVPVIRHLRTAAAAGGNGGPVPAGTPRLPDTCVGAPAPAAVGRPCDGRAGVIAIAVSTGGPQALARLLPALPADLPATVLIAQHISDGFAAGMAAWLDTIAPLPVQVAVQGEPALPSHVYLADPVNHLLLTPVGRLRLMPRGEGDLYRPSCDQLLGSVATAAGPRAVGVILTGMGRDGARGIAEIAAAGGMTIAQDEASSVVFGMNREAIQGGHVRQVLPLEAIAGALLCLTGYGCGRRGEPCR